MTCLTDEQLTAYAMGLENADLPLHLSECDACQGKLADLQRLSNELAAAHAELDRRHATTRARILSQMADRETPGVSTIPWKRFAFGGIGLSSAVAALLLLTVFVSSSSQLSAMERIEKAVRDVRSFTYLLTNVTDRPPREDKPARTLDGKTFTYWRAPADPNADEFGDLRATMTHEWTYHRPTGDEGSDLTLDITEIHPSGKPGILWDSIAKKYRRVPTLHAGDIANSTPLLWLRAVREKSGEITQDLGTKRINGREARGYEMTFDDTSSFRNFGPVEVWIDPQTDLPVEFSFEHANAHDNDADDWTDKYEVTDIQWDMDLDPKLFDTTPPAGFIDITLPDDERSVADITAALKLYAELSGGRFPHVEKLDNRFYGTKFDADACYREMLKMAGVTDNEQNQSTGDATHQRIKQVRPGLERLERVLESEKWLVGYNGEATANDADKVLLWWNAALELESDKDEKYRLIYGDLRTEIVPREKWVQFVTPEIAAIQ